MDNQQNKKTLPDSEPRSFGAIDFLLELNPKISDTRILSTDRLRTTSVAKDEVLLAKAEPAVNQFSASVTEPGSGTGLSLYDMFLMTRTEGEKAELSIAPNSVTVAGIRNFVKDNPDIGNMVLSTNGQTVNQLIKNYNPDHNGPAKQYFDGATVYRPSPSMHIPDEKLSLWDEDLSKFRRRSDFGRRRAPVHGGSTFHKGIDIGTPNGTDLHSEGQTQVAFAGRAKGFGNVVILSHGDGVYTLYGHLSRIGVRKGQMLEDGQKFADTGRSGIVTGPCLHLEVLVESKGRLYAIDPDLVSKGKLDLRTPEGRAEAVLMNARHEGVSVARTASLMQGKIKLPAPEFSPS